MAEPLPSAGRVAVVTGAGAVGGLGRAHAMHVAAQGCRVVVNDVGLPFGDDVPAAEHVAAEIRAAGGEAVADTHDVVTEAAGIVATALEAFGGVDIVVNNAGIGASTPIGPDASDEWARTIDVSLTGSIAVTGAAWPHLERSGAGRVVMTASNTMFGAPRSAAYSTAKSAMYGLTRSLAGEGRRSGIAVNCIMPAAWTRLTAALPPGPVAELMEARFPPEAVASFVAWLCSPSCPVSGEAFSVGGWRAARVVLAETVGAVVEPEAEPTVWGEVLEEVMATEGLAFPTSSSDEVSWLAHTVGGEVPEAYRSGGALAWDRKPR
jgi:NAD(P)-dependent dehydrogenase (short-subunit alcohol dehydrogenase family)